MELLLLRLLWLAKPALTIEVENSRLAAEKLKKEMLAAVGVDVMETLVKYSKEEELVGTKFKLVLQTPSSNVLRYKRETHNCKLLKKSNLLEQWPLWKSAGSMEELSSPTCIPPPPLFPAKDMSASPTKKQHSTV